MRSNLVTLAIATLLGLVPLARVSPSLAQSTRPSNTTYDWQKGRKLTPASDQAMRLCAGTLVTAIKDSQVEVQTSVPLPNAIGGLGPYAYSARLISGRVNVTVDASKKPANAVFIHGPKQTAVFVSGGSVSVVVQDQTVAVGVYAGKEATIGIGSTWKHVTAGRMLVISPQSPGGLESPLPTAPANVTVARPVMSVEGASDPTRAVWQPVTGASRYRVHLQAVGASNGRALFTSDAHLALSGLSAGRYELRVAALTPFNLEGSDSLPAYVNVVGVELPPGGYFSEGRAFIEPGQQVKLSHVEGLEMTYDRAPVYIKAVERTGLRNGSATTLHLRTPGSSERVSLELLPRDLDTTIELTPALARWPRDKVRIHIALPPSIAKNQAFTLIPSVTVNSLPLELDWVRTDNALESVVPAPPIYPGPWVLRAQVTDQHGFILGHNFLEIASMAGETDETPTLEIHRKTQSADLRTPPH